MASGVARSGLKLFVGNLPWTVHSKDLKKYFSEFGYVTWASVVFNKKTGMSRGYGFIVVGTQQTVAAITNKQNHHLEGQVLTVASASE